VHEGID